MPHKHVSVRFLVGSVLSNFLFQALAALAAVLMLQFLRLFYSVQAELVTQSVEAHKLHGTMLSSLMADGFLSELFKDCRIFFL